MNNGQKGVCSLPRRYKAIPGTNGLYGATRSGKIASAKRNHTKGGVLAFTMASGYYRVSICINGVKVSKTVHSLVADAFIPNPLNLACINHKNGNKLDNRVKNLERCTLSENQKHRYEVLGHTTPNRLFSPKQIRSILLSQQSNRYFADKYNVSIDCIQKIRKGDNYKKEYSEFKKLEKPQS